jgi:hypothetical protein
VHLLNLATLLSDFVAYTFSFHKWTISKIQLKTQENVWIDLHKTKYEKVMVDDGYIDSHHWP